MAYLNYNGNLIITDQALIKADNRGFKYGDGLFETMKMEQGNICLFDDHMDRLFSGMHLLAFDIPDPINRFFLLQQINELCEKNNHSSAARIRLMLFRGSGGLYGGGNHIPHYIIESSPLPADAGELNKEGYITGLYKDARKQIDSFSGLKTNNYLSYTMGAIYARQQGWNDCLLTNTSDTICESTIANVFIIKGSTIITPSLNQGCVAGIMRKHILSVLPGWGYTVREEAVTPEMIKNADELFLTNAIQGLRWVEQFEDIHYQNKNVTYIYNALRKERIKTRSL